MSPRKIGKWAIWLAALLIGLSIILSVIIVPITRWVTQNSVLITLIGALVLIVVGSILAVGYKRLKRKMRILQEKELRRHREAERQSEAELRKKEAFEAEQMAMGLAKYRDRQGLELWGSPEDIENWKRIDAEDRKLELAQEKEEVIDILLDRVKKCHQADFEGLHQDQVHHLLNNWKIQISTLLNEGKSADTIIDVMCRKK